MPLKKIHNYSSKTSYALNFNQLRVEFRGSDCAYVRVPAIAVKKYKDDLQVTYGEIHESVYNGNKEALAAVHATDPQVTIDWLLENWDGRYGISWVAKLSSEDDIILADSNSFADYAYYFNALAGWREFIEVDGSVEGFEGWYLNA